MSERRVEVLGVKSKAELRAERRTIQVLSFIKLYLM